MTNKTRRKLKRTNKRNNKNTKKFKSMNCAPKNNELDFTCYTTAQLNSLKNKWNQRHPDVLINDSNPRNIWNKIKKYTSNTCYNEKCWLNTILSKSDLDSELKNYTFSPNKPESWSTNPSEWLTSVDIENVMAQYEMYNKDFIFIGPSPINFYDTHEDGDCVWPELCNFNINNMIKRKKSKIGICFNLDPHYKPGSHWVSLFIDIDKNKIIYFDSNGDHPPSSVKKLIKLIKSYFTDKDIPIDVYINKLEHQKQNNECGMYSLYFMISMLKNKNYDTIFKNRIPDINMFNLRDKYFN